MKEYILISHLNGVEEYPRTHVVPLYPQQLGRILIELGVVSELITDNVGIQEAAILGAYLVFNVFYIDRVVENKFSEFV